MLKYLNQLLCRLLNRVTSSISTCVSSSSQKLHYFKKLKSVILSFRRRGYVINGGEVLQFLKSK